MPNHRWGNRSRHERGYDAEYTRNRDLAIKRDMGLCQPCLREGRMTPFAQVDHIKPKHLGLDNSPPNLQCICSTCHAEKSARERGRPLRQRIGSDIWKREPIG